MAQKVLLISPPFVQLNTPYPATTYLKGYLNTLDIASNQTDLGIEVILELFSRKGLSDIFLKADKSKDNSDENINRILRLKDEYLSTIDAVIAFLQNQNPTLAHRICSRNYLPEAGRFVQVDDLDWSFGNMGTHDKARHLATLFLEDLSDLIVATIDSNFGFSRYAEKIASAASTFDELDKALQEPDSHVDEILLKLLKLKIEKYQPTVAGFSVPFPGNLYSTLKCGQWLKKHHPEIKILMGGGYPNTELRSLSDPRIFNYVDFITLDDGEAPLKVLLEFLDKGDLQPALKRTYLLKDKKVIYSNTSSEKDVPQHQVGTPDYTDLPLKKYLSVIETANPMHRLWSDGRWNKLTLAHGCYWGRCTFCDISLDYIQRFEPNIASTLCDRIEAIIQQTGETGFHFVDEAAPPSLLKSLALEIIKRKINITWWTNIRFEKNFTRDLCFLLKTSGCIAVSGGLEVASDRLLGLINKGVTIAQVSKVAHYFTQSGIMVHAYLMYGFPTQTAQETIDSLEVVRQMFEAGVVQSGFWHHFAMTAHSPIGIHPEQFLVTNGTKEQGTFANNELECIDPKGTDHWKFSDGLRKSLYNYMHEVGFDIPLKDWFDFKVPQTTVAPNYILNILQSITIQLPSPNATVVWLGHGSDIRFHQKKKKGRVFENAELHVHTGQESFHIKLSKEEGIWLHRTMNQMVESKKTGSIFKELQTDFEAKVPNGDFILFWNSKELQKLRSAGLLIL